MVEADNRAAVESFLARDPYVEAGLFAASEIHPWLWRRGNPYLSPAEER